MCEWEGPVAAVPLGTLGLHLVGHVVVLRLLQHLRVHEVDLQRLLALQMAEGVSPNLLLHCHAHMVGRRSLQRLLALRMGTKVDFPHGCFPVLQIAHP